MNWITKIINDWKYYKYKQTERVNPTLTETFEEWFDRQGFKHFKSFELNWYFSKVRTYTIRGIVYTAKNKYPRRDLWRNIIPAINILDKLREHFDKPINISSTYRDLPYNRAIKSPDGSLHVSFKAVDFTVEGVKPSLVFATLKKWRDEKKFVGGIGKYPNFIHLDTRPYNVTW